MKLLISPVDKQEAIEAVAGGADIIDVKNPEEGPLGASFPWVINAIREVTPKDVEMSCTLGDVPNLPGTATLAALGAASLGVNYVKVGFGRLKTEAHAVNLMRSIVRAVKDQDSSINVVATGYADADRVGSVHPSLISRIGVAAECDFAMLDTAVKDGKTLIDFMNAEELGHFVNTCHSHGLKAALAGSLQKEHLSVLCNLGADVIGVRGAACTGGDRVHGRITREKVRQLARAVRGF
ncbi:MAG: (5-formylfuran-3-yl)methyl phosphate synthase [Candidatus Bathyarchaeia archaeon]